MQTRLAVIVIFGLLAPVTARADLTKCDGVWTNKPCAGVPAAGHMTESQPTPRSQKDIDAQQKRELVNELDTRRLTLRGQYGVDVGISPERSLCSNPETTVAECARAVNEKERYLDERALAAANLKAAERQASSIPAETQGPGNITIVQQSGDQYIDGRHVYRRTPRPGFTNIPDNVPPPPISNPRQPPPRRDPPSPPKKDPPPQFDKDPNTWQGFTR